MPQVEINTVLVMHANFIPQSWELGAKRVSEDFKFFQTFRHFIVGTICFLLHFHAFQAIPQIHCD